MIRNKKLLIFLALILLITGCSSSNNTISDRNAVYPKELSRVSRYSGNIPLDYSLIDYKDKALKLDDLLFGPHKEGPYLPLSWQDETYNSIGIPAYVGDDRMHNDGEQEAVTVLAGILSATQMGIDKSNQNGQNYVSQMSAFFSKEEGIVLNNPSGSSVTTSMWYLIYPAILFSQVSILYPQENEIREQTLTCIESWYEAFLKMRDENDFTYTGYNFITNEPYRNDIWIEPDCAAGLAVLFYYGYELTNKQDYLTAAMDGISYLNSYFGSPLYEALLYFAPHLSSMFNTMFSTSFNTQDLIDDVLNGSSIPRGGWGSMAGKWGDYDMSGLMGSTTDGGGYAFAMNTFAAAYAMSPTAKYDTRFSASIGKWLLHVVSNSRYYFSDQTNKENQSHPDGTKVDEFAAATGHIVPYEGIRKSMHSVTPWFGGDPTVYGWAETDFSLYSGVHIGLLASIFEETNVEAILKIDLNKADLFNQKYPVYLLYNPHPQQKTVTYQTNGGKAVDLFDSATKKIIASNVSDTDVQIPPGEALVLFELPPQSTVSHTDTRYLVGDTVIASDAVSLCVLSHKNNDEVSGKFTIKAGFFQTNSNDKVKSVSVTVDDRVFSFDSLDKITFNAAEIGTGSKTFHINLLTDLGLTDQTQLRLNIR